VKAQATLAYISHLPCDELWNARTFPFDQHLFGQVCQGSDLLIRQRTSTYLHKDATHGPDVNLLSDLGLAIKEFWRHIPGRTSVVLFGDMCPIHGLGKSKVTNLDIEAQIQNNIQGLKVPMDDGRSLAMQIRHSI